MTSVQLRVRLVLASSIFSILLVAPSFAQEDEAVAVADRVVESLMKAWNNHDGNAYAAEFWPDAEFMNIQGGIMKGQQEIASRHDQMLKGKGPLGALSARQLKMTIRKVRMLAPNVIIVDSDDTDAGTATQATTRLKLILEKRGEIWRIVAAQNTRVANQTAR